MYYNDLIKIVEEQIELCEQEATELKNKLQDYVGLDKIESSDVPFMDNLRQQLDACEKNILAYKQKREMIIAKMLKAGSIGINEFIWLLEQFGLYYKTINHAGKTLVVPIDYCLLPNRNLEEQKLSSLRADKIYYADNIEDAEKGLKVMPAFKTVEQYNVYERVVLSDEELGYKREALRKQAQATQKAQRIKGGTIGAIISNLFNKGEDIAEPVVEAVEYRLLNNTPMTMEEIAKIRGKFSPEVQKNFVCEKLPNKAVANDFLKDMTPIMELGALEGIRIYVREGNNVKLNPALLNVCNYEILGFLEDYANARYQDVALNLQKYYNHVQSPKVVSASQSKQVYKSGNIELEPSQVESIYAKNFIGFYNKVLAEYPTLSMLEIWTKYFDMAQAQEYEIMAIDESILALFSDSDIEFMEYYNGCKKANPNLTFSVIENCYVNDHAGRYRVKK